MPEQPSLSFAQIQAAMQAMINRAMQTPAEPVAMAIVDATGNLLISLETVRAPRGRGVRRRR